MKELIGPSLREQWFYWKYATPEQRTRSYIKAELERLLSHNNRPHPPTLADDELTAVRKNLQAQNIEVDEAMVNSALSTAFNLHPD